jgi:hypothetical protein
MNVPAELLVKRIIRNNVVTTDQLGVQAAIHYKFTACHIARLVGRKKQHRLCQFVRGGNPHIRRLPNTLLLESTIRSFVSLIPVRESGLAASLGF